jgi:hypothetical protein
MVLGSPLLYRTLRLILSARIGVRYRSLNAYSFQHFIIDFPKVALSLIVMILIILWTTGTRVLHLTRLLKPEGSGNGCFVMRRWASGKRL